MDKGEEVPVEYASKAKEKPKSKRRKCVPRRCLGNFAETAQQIQMLMSEGNNKWRACLLVSNHDQKLARRIYGRYNYTLERYGGRVTRTHGNRLLSDAEEEQLVNSVCSLASSNVKLKKGAVLVHLAEILGRSSLRNNYQFINELIDRHPEKLEPILSKNYRRRTEMDSVSYGETVDSILPTDPRLQPL